ISGTPLKIRSGVYRITRNCISASAAIDAANYARRQIQENDKDCVCVYDEAMEKKYRLENEIRHGLNSAVEQKQMKVCFQPRIALSDHTMLGAEALLRWERPDGSVLYPGDFIPLYEQTGRILELDFYVLERTAEFLEHCIREGKRVVPISINFSILHTAADNTVERFLEILNRHGIDPSLIEVELTETATAAEYEKVRQLFQKLQEAGIRTALDDFGAGYSLLNMVLDVPIHTIKVDKGLLDNCFVRTTGRRFFKKLIPFLNELGYHVVCEGVETEQQEIFVRKAGCREVQGNLFSGVLSMEEFEQKLQ
ncbi:MAG: EAL domain-containing protein, partial [Clostridiaceae bacterium]|nr:EAL domain-containing protein [Clostridiaceae bacterium]